MCNNSRNQSSCIDDINVDRDKNDFELLVLSFTQNLTFKKYFTCLLLNVTYSLNAFRSGKLYNQTRRNIIALRITNVRHYENSLRKAIKTISFDSKNTLHFYTNTYLRTDLHTLVTYFFECSVVIVDSQKWKRLREMAFAGINRWDEHAVDKSDRRQNGDYAAT